MMKRLITISLLFLSAGLMAQQRPIQSLYMFDPLLINPAYAGIQTQLSATAIYRNQWVNLDGAPKTFTTTVHSGFLRNRVGLGLIAAADRIGIHDDVSLYGAYSYRIKLDRTTTLSMGIQGGFNSLRSDFNKLNLKNLDDPNLGGVYQRYLPNVGAGLFLRHNDFYLGFSAPYLINNKTTDLPQNLNFSRQRRYYYLTGGIKADLGEYVQVFPSALMRFQDDAPYSMDINTMVILYKAVGLGASYRLKDSVVGLFELQLNDNFHVGYAYDFTTSRLSQFSAGTHEIMINYRVKITRIHAGLECPSYW